MNLNDLGIDTDGPHLQPLQDYSQQDEDIAVHFRDLESRLIGLIQEAQLVVGCVAWLTSNPILDALAKVPSGVSLVVQKEDFLRPDINARNGWAESLRKKYEALVEPPGRYDMGDLVSSLSVACDPTIHPVRCVGNHNSTAAPAFPRMHNKFLVFCFVDWVREYEDFDYERALVGPYAVWTGSFNLTANATASLENAVVIRRPSIARAYFNEWQQILALSEPLDWRSEWCAPEWRIGT